jgi:acetyltransferase-like isoleucine patch superfamily enzyme
MTWRASFNGWRRRVLRRWLYQPLFGERSQGAQRPRTRISPATVIEHEQHLALGDDVYIGPFNFIEASAGISIEDGVQVTTHVVIVTHTSHRSQRLLGPAYTTWPVPPGEDRPGWISGPVRIGAYSFIGPHSLIEANTDIGRGTLVCAGSFVRGRYPDFAILEGRPARIVGDSRRADEKLLAQYPDLRVLYDSWVNADADVDAGDGGDLRDGGGPAR